MFKYVKIIFVLLFVSCLFINAGCFKKDINLRKQAESGNPQAQFQLGLYYYLGKIDGKVDYEKAVYWFTKSAEQGNTNAQTNLGIMYENGQGVKQDYAEALKWYRKSAEHC